MFAVGGSSNNIILAIWLTVNVISITISSARSMMLLPTSLADELGTRLMCPIVPFPGSSSSTLETSSSMTSR